MEVFRKKFFGNGDAVIVLASGSPRRRELLERLGGASNTSEKGDLRLAVVPSKFAEDFCHDSFATPREYVLATAMAKGVEVVEKIARKDGNDTLPSNFKDSQLVLVISADTIVTLPPPDDDYDTTTTVTATVTTTNVTTTAATWKILEKPKDKNDAKAMLKCQSGRDQVVMTAVCLFLLRKDKIILDGTGKLDLASLESRHFVEETRVSFGNLTDELIDWYVDDRADLSDGPLDKAGAYGYQGFPAYFIKEISGCHYNVVGLPCHKLLTEIVNLLSK